MFRARLFVFSLLAVSLGCSRSPRVPADWVGDYIYEADFGPNAPGTEMMVTYKLHLQGTTCTFSADGYQTDEQLLCTVHPEGSTLDIRFRSFAGDSSKNAYGNEPYKPNASLFTLAHSPGGRLFTRWAAYHPDDEKPAKGSYFQRDTTPASAR